MPTKHFELEDNCTASQLISKNNFLTKLDLENVYFLVSENKSSCKYLRFVFQDQCFEFVLLSVLTYMLSRS